VPVPVASLATDTDTFFLLNYRTNPRSRYVVFSAWSPGRDRHDPVVHVGGIAGGARTG
jgi:hypothetical protein